MDYFLVTPTLVISLVIQEEFVAHHYLLALLTSERSFVMVGIDVTLKKYLISELFLTFTTRKRCYLHARSKQTEGISWHNLEEFVT